MPVTIHAENVQDAAFQLGLTSRRRAIVILWRRDEESVGRRHKHGCIVDATSTSGNDVPLSFGTVNEALDCIRAMLLQHEHFVEHQDDPPSLKVASQKCGMDKVK